MNQMEYQAKELKKSLEPASAGNTREARSHCFGFPRVPIINTSPISECNPKGFDIIHV